MYGTSITPPTFGFGTLHGFLDYLGKCGHIKLEFGFVKSVETSNLNLDLLNRYTRMILTNMGLATNPTSFTMSDCVSGEEKYSKTESVRFFLRMKM